MKRVFVLLALLFAFVAPASSGVHFIYENRGAAAPACTGGYQGPGDISSGAAMWGGFRAYSCAAAGALANAVVLCTPSDVACETEKVNAAGNLALGTVGSTCNTSTVICTVKQLFDQANAGAGWSNASIGNRPTFNPSLVGGKPGMVCTASSSQILTASIANTAQPGVLTLVFSNQGAGGGTYALLNTPNWSLYLAGSNNIRIFSGSSGIGDAVVGTNTWHTVEAGVASGGSGVFLDAVLGATGASGSSASGTSPNICSDGSNPASIQATEAGIWFSDITGSVSAMNTNQKAYWGF